jgi:hypothetical protein
MTPSIEIGSIQQQGDGLFLRQLPTIREMLGSLDTLTINGRQHLMIKVVDFLRDNGVDAVRGIGWRNQRAVMELLDGLAVESHRPMPDVKQFAQRAESVVALLAATATA